MATRPVVLNLPGELIDALDEIAHRSGSTTVAVAEQALVQMLLQHRHADGVASAAADDIDTLISA